MSDIMDLLQWCDMLFYRIFVLIKKTIMLEKMLPSLPLEPGRMFFLWKYMIRYYIMTTRFQIRHNALWYEILITCVVSTDLVLNWCRKSSRPLIADPDRLHRRLERNLVILVYHTITMKQNDNVRRNDIINERLIFPGSVLIIIY